MKDEYEFIKNFVKEGELELFQKIILKDKTMYMIYKVIKNFKYYKKLEEIMEETKEDLIQPSKKFEDFNKNLTINLKQLFKSYLNLQEDIGVFIKLFFDFADALENEKEKRRAFEILKTCGIHEIDDSYIKYRIIENTLANIETGLSKRRENK